MTTAGICRVPDGMPAMVIWPMRQPQETRSIMAAPVQIGITDAWVRPDGSAAMSCPTVSLVPVSRPS
jgi:hypothetical protein